VAEKQSKNIIFNDSLIEDLEELRKQQGRSFSEMVRECCRVYIEQKKAAQLTLTSK
jgi:metal-responsive CopG/Arc/MetJ family transcriptional regulator